jgi:hypothetical protein
VALVGQRKALAIAVRNDRAAERFSCLYDRLFRSQHLARASGVSLPLSFYGLKYAVIIAQSIAVSGFARPDRTRRRAGGSL